MKKAAEEKSPGTAMRAACNDWPPSMETLLPLRISSTPKPASIRSV